jgi:hypothetical protein
MTRIFIGFIICLLLSNCTKKVNKSVVKNKPYIISNEIKKLQKYTDSLKDNKSKIVPPPSTKGFFYGESQLVIDQKGDFYYYQKEYIQIFCSYGSEKDTIPHFLGLKPKDIIKIPPKSLNDFISENILTKDQRRQILIIASQSDTIKNDYFLNFLKSSIIQMYHIRKTTQEEDSVLKYKKNKGFYDFENIKWDKTKIKFPEYIKFEKEKCKTKT